MSDSAPSSAPLLLTERVDAPPRPSSLSLNLLKLAILALAFVLAPELVISSALIFASVVFLTVSIGQESDEI